MGTAAHGALNVFNAATLFLRLSRVLWVLGSDPGAHALEACPVLPLPGHPVPFFPQASSCGKQRSKVNKKHTPACSHCSGCWAGSSILSQGVMPEAQACLSLLGPEEAACEPAGLTLRCGAGAMGCPCPHTSHILALASPSARTVGALATHSMCLSAS